MPNRTRIPKKDSMPGTAHHILNAPNTYKKEKNIIHGFLVLLVSEIAPSIGPRIASNKPTNAVITPHRDCPNIGSPTTTDAKYGANIKVNNKVLYG
jgi:hypothetical protein